MAPHTTGTPLSCTLVTSAADMARMLRDASALHAPGYALAAHETACEHGDAERMAFWLDVCRDLQTLAARDDLEAA